jgi:hypothetical protein
MESKEQRTISDQSVEERIKQIKYMSISELKELPIFSIVSYKSMYQKALASCIQALYNPTIQLVEVGIMYKTNLGESLQIASNYCEWNTSRAYKLTWSEGHIWKATVKPKSLHNDLEYKYITASKSNIKWENGPNRRFSLQTLQLLLNAHPQQKPGMIEIMEGSQVFKFMDGVLSFTDVWQS